MSDDLLHPNDGDQGLTPPPIRMWVLALAVICALVFAGIVLVRVLGNNQNETASTKALIQKIEREAGQRREQSCLLFEGDHLDDVNQLKATYRFLSDPKERHGELTPAIVQSLPALEARARKDRAPDYCDLPGVKAETLWKTSHHKRGAPPVGNPEPDPVLPKHRSFTYLLKPSTSR